VNPLEYPKMAHTANIQGEVVLVASVDANGIPKQIKQKSGNALLADDIARQLLTWKFSPSSSDWTIDITIRFILTEPSATNLAPSRVTIESPARITVESQLVSPDKFVERYTKKSKKQ
jgi:TonB family protein